MAKGLKPGKQGLDVPDVVQQIRQHDDVVGPGRRNIGRQHVRVRLVKLEMGMALARRGDAHRREVDADADRRLQRREQIAVGASHFEHALPGRDQKAIDVLEAPVVRPRRAAPHRGQRRPVPVLDALRAIGRSLAALRALSRLRNHAVFKAAS